MPGPQRERRRATLCSGLLSPSPPLSLSFSLLLSSLLLVKKENKYEKAARRMHPWPPTRELNKFQLDTWERFRFLRPPPWLGWWLSRGSLIWCTAWVVRLKRGLCVEKRRRCSKESFFRIEERRISIPSNYGFQFSFRAFFFFFFFNIRNHRKFLQNGRQTSLVVRWNPNSLQSNRLNPR